MAQNKIFHGEPTDVEMALNRFEKEMNGKMEKVTRIISPSTTPGCMICLISWEPTNKYKV